MTFGIDFPHWKCPKCDGLNSRSRVKCLECDLPIPENPNYKEHGKRKTTIKKEPYRH